MSPDSGPVFVVGRDYLTIEVCNCASRPWSRVPCGAKWCTLRNHRRYEPPPATPIPEEWYADLEERING